MIETTRLLIRPWREKEAQQFYELSQDSGFRSFPITDWRQKSVQAAIDWIVANNKSLQETKTGVFAIEEKDTKRILGIAALRLLRLDLENRHEITYRLIESAWGKGFATEAATALLDYGFNRLNLNEIAASITPDNVASIKVAEKIGMRKTGSELMLGIPAEILRIQRAQFLKR